MTDIVERLRNHEQMDGHASWGMQKLCRDAADEITRLREALATEIRCSTKAYEMYLEARNAALEEAAQKIESKTTIGGHSVDFIQGYMGAQRRFAADIRALKGEPK